MKDTIPRDHFNLYYIFLEDKKQNSLSGEAAQKIKEKIFNTISKKPP